MMARANNQTMLLDSRSVKYWSEKCNCYTAHHFSHTQMSARGTILLLLLLCLLLLLATEILIYVKHSYIHRLPSPLHTRAHTRIHKHTLNRVCFVFSTHFTFVSVCLFDNRIHVHCTVVYKIQRKVSTHWIERERYHPKNKRNVYWNEEKPTIQMIYTNTHTPIQTCTLQYTWTLIQAQEGKQASERTRSHLNYWKYR